MAIEDEAILAVEILEGRGLAAPRVGHFQVGPVTNPASAEEALASLRAFGGQGWVCFTDQVIEVHGTTTIPGGTPLSAELCKGNESLHLRQSGPAWLLVRVTCTDGGEHLVFTEHRPQLGGGTLVYEIAWRREVDAWRPWCARLSAVVGGEN